jgi:uncharacterized protein YggE
MKNLLIIFLFFISFLEISNAQNVNEPKHIAVTGSAEMEIIPDEIYFTIILQEYLNKDKVKVEMTVLEKELQNSVNAAGIAKENLQFENVYGQQWANKKKKPTDFFAKKTYVVKLIEPSKIDAIINKIDGEGINNVYISNYSHSKIEQFKKDLQIKALVSAKEKATYLLAAINEQVGPAKYISEKQNISIGGFYMDAKEISNNEYRQFNTPLKDDGGSSNEISFKTITLRFEIDAQFFIK